MADGSGCTYLESFSVHECGYGSGNSDGEGVLMFCTTFCRIFKDAHSPLSV
jgi:hypothetical protein